MENENIDVQNNQLILERFRELPKIVQEAIVNSGWENKIRIIAQKNNLVIGDASILESNTFLVMLGIISPKNYLSTLKDELKLPDEILDSIVNSVEDEIFKDIKEKLVEIGNDSKEDPEFISVEKEKKDTIMEKKLFSPREIVKENTTIVINDDQNTNQPKQDPYREPLL
jgi:hypothetical protein